MNRSAYVLRCESDLRHYSAAAFVLRCFDDRFYQPFKEFIKKNGWAHIDPQSVAGGAKVLASPEKESDRDFMLREIEKSVRLHHTKKVMLFTHHDCGAYGGFSAFQNNLAKELAFHSDELKKAGNIIQKKFPGLEIETYFIDAKGIIKI